MLRTSNIEFTRVCERARARECDAENRESRISGESRESSRRTRPKDDGDCWKRQENIFIVPCTVDRIDNVVLQHLPGGMHRDAFAVNPDCAFARNRGYNGERWSFLTASEFCSFRYWGSLE